MGDTVLNEIQLQYKISVVIPTYNREKTIKRCLDSVVNQTYPVCEIIVIDDGSRDKTLDIIRTEYGNRVKVIRQKHKGAQAARNAGIRAASGEYIAFLDSDDEWLLNKIELQVEILNTDRNVVICGNGYLQRDWKGKIPTVYRKSKNGQKQFKTGTRKLYRMNGKSGFVYKLILKESFCLFQALLTSKSNLVEMGLLDENVPSYQEWDTAIRLAKKNKFAYIEKPLFIYHLHDGETISKSAKKEIDGLEYIYEKHKEEIRSLLGKQELKQRYKGLMKKCAVYRDKRMFKYFFKYISERR